jgi:hypothetical protein
MRWILKDPKQVKVWGCRDGQGVLSACVCG